MAPKDYVSRGRASARKKPAATAKKSAPKSAPTPWGRIVLVLAVVIGFAYFLWTIKDSAPESATPITQQGSGKTEPEEALPEPPEEQWEYIQELENPPEDKFEKVEPLSANRPDIQYQMQCGSFRQKSQAEEMRARIAFQALESEIRATEGQTGLWYRVVLGPFETKRSAEADRHKLQRAGISTCRIWRWN